MAEIRETENTKCWHVTYGARVTLILCWWECSHFEKPVWTPSTKVEYMLVLCPSNSITRYRLKGNGYIYPHEKTHVRLYIAVSLRIAKTRAEISISRRIGISWYRHSVDYYTERKKR